MADMRTEDCQRHNGPNSWMFLLLVHCYADSPRSSFLKEETVHLIIFYRKLVCFHLFLFHRLTGRRATIHPWWRLPSSIKPLGLTLFIMMMMVIIIIIIIIVSLLLLSSLLSIEPPRLILDDEGKWFESIMMIMNIIVISHHRNYHHHHHSHLVETISTQSECDLFGKYHHCYLYPWNRFHQIRILLLSQATQPDETFRRFESEENDPTYLDKKTNIGKSAKLKKITSNVIKWDGHCQG